MSDVPGEDVSGEAVGDLDFTGRVVVITGAGRGVGRAHARAFAERGASVVVNDLGGAGDGSVDGPREGVAQEVVDTITGAGGIAIADNGDISDPAVGSALITKAIESFGRVDIVVNNAGIDRAIAFREVTPEILNRFLSVHVIGTHNLTSAAWPHFVAQSYGRVINTTSSAGYFGLGQALPYATAKGALHGLTQALAVEGVRHGITVNAVAPFASSRLAADRTRKLPELASMIERLAPAELISPVVLWLAHHSTTVTGAAFETGAGAVCRTFVGQSEGIWSAALTPEYLRDHSDQLLDTGGADVLLAGNDRALTRWITQLTTADRSS
ncbi:MAG: putative short-chain type dehydrogenase/reductase [Pseudonocardiales bacterium]|nr:putative short-chain type dehydrogenase/reductase [Pseudonocardiales bacterium]